MFRLDSSGCAFLSDNEIYESGHVLPGRFCLLIRILLMRVFGFLRIRGLRLYALPDRLRRGPEHHIMKTVDTGDSTATRILNLRDCTHFRPQRPMSTREKQVYHIDS